MKLQNDNFKIKIFIGFLFIFLFLSKSTLAVCPLCTVAVAGGIEVTRLLGVDDLISSIWIGGLIVSMGLWFSDFLAKKKIFKPVFREFVSLVIFYFLTVPFLFWSKMIGIPGNKYLGIDKIILGIGLGSVIFLLGVFGDIFLRKLNKGKVFIYYQKIILPVLFLTIISLVFYKIL